MQITEEMVQRLKQEDEFARREFWNMCFGPVLVISSRILGPGPVAVDVTTDLLNDFLFHYVQNLSNPQGSWSYLKLMVIRRSVRERQRMMTREEFNEHKAMEADASPPELETSLLVPRLNQCLELLTPKAQSALRLKYRQGLSNEEVGRQVGGSKQYIGRLFRKSLELLRECLQRKAVANG